MLPQADVQDYIVLIYLVLIGGWVLGNLNSEAAWCRHMCNKVGIKIIDVDYRLAPEFPYPTSIHDSWDAVKWVFHQNF